MVSIEKAYALVLPEDTSKRWPIPPDCLKDVNGILYFQLKTHKYGLVKFLLSEDTKLPKNPSLKGSQGIEAIVKQRNQMSGLCPEASCSLFDEGEQQTKTSKKRKAALKASQCDKDLAVELAGYGKLMVKPAQYLREDICVPFTEEQLGILFKFVIDQGITVNGSDESRQYQRSGKFAKKAKQGKA